MLAQVSRSMTRQLTRWRLTDQLMSTAERETRRIMELLAELAAAMDAGEILTDDDASRDAVLALIIDMQRLADERFRLQLACLSYGSKEAEKDLAVTIRRARRKLKACA